MNTQVFPRMHVSLYVSNIQKTTAFYTSFFGMEPTKVKSNYAKYILETPSLIISFVENKERVHENFGHLGFQVETREQLKERLEDAKLKNFVPREEIGTKCCYAEQDKFWVNDPDGVQWEVYYFHADAEFNDPHYETEAAAACCTPAENRAKGEACCTPSDKLKVNLSALADKEKCC